MQRSEIVFEVQESPEAGYEARALGYSIHTQAKSWEQLKEMLREAVRRHFGEGQAPRLIRIRLVREEVIPLRGGVLATEKTSMRRDEVLATLSCHQEELKGLGVRTLAIFGSVARDEAGSDSDVDILVELDRPAGLFKFAEVKEYLEGILGRPVDLATPDGLHPALRDMILREAVRAA